MSDETTLLSCPFCGGESKLKEYKPNVSGVAICEECGARSPICKNDHTGGWRPKAIAVWNTRAPVEYDGWFYLPKPKESIVQYGEQRIEKTEHCYKVTQPVEVIESAIRSWSDDLGEYIMKRICEAWNTRAELSSGNADTDDALALLDEIREAGRISYDDYSQLFDAIAELGSGTCELTMDGTDGCFGCSECLENIPPLSNFCPNCGRKVVER